jgi:hypothetical protein
VSVTTLAVDAQCPRCTRAGRAIKLASAGEIELVSLHDPDLRTILDRERPGWRFRPTLVTYGADRVQVRTGLGMGFALTRTIGLRQTLGVLRLLGDEPVAGTAKAGPDGGTLT